MKLQNLTTGDLLNYSTILENIITTNLEMQKEMSRAITGEFCTKDEIEPLYSKSRSASEEADSIYEEIQKEIDLRAKKDLGMKFGVRRTQTIIKELDAFVAKKNLESERLFKIQQEEAARIANENHQDGSVADMKIVSDADNPE